MIHATEPEPAAGTLSPAWLRSKPLRDCLLALADAERQRIVGEGEVALFREWTGPLGEAERPRADTSRLYAQLEPWDALLLRLLPHPSREELRAAWRAFAEAAGKSPVQIPEPLRCIMPAPQTGPAGVDKLKVRLWRDASSVGRGRPRVPGEDWALWALERQQLAWLAGERIPSGQSLWFEFHGARRPPDYNRHLLPALLGLIGGCGIALPW